MGIGEAHRREPEHVLGGDGHPQVPRRDRLSPGRAGPGHRADEPVDHLGIGGQSP